MRRSCLTCKLRFICKGYDGTHNAIQGMTANMDSDSIGEIFHALGNACTLYSREFDIKTHGNEK